MLLRIKLVLWYILFCIRLLAPPWKYFQLNAVYFNHSKGIFSKLEMDELIPKRWRLAQEPLEKAAVPTEYPVFIKPEWGQNAHGIHRADVEAAYLQLRQKLLSNCSAYMVQAAAKERREFEIFYIRKDNSEEFAILSATEAINADNDRYPINSVLNHNSSFFDLCPQLTDPDRRRLWQMLNTLGHFRIARVGIRADGLADLIAGNFHIIEINLFTPLPLRLLDPRLDKREKNRFIRHSMMALARATKAMPKAQPHKPVFFRQLSAHYRIKS